jgi:hypothetical protein
MPEPVLIEAASPGPNPRAHWPVELQQEFLENADNPCVGNVLVSETDDLRVWHFSLPAGERYTFHCHVLNYFWTCHSHGIARGWYDDGRIQDVHHYPGETKHFTFAKGEKFIHSVGNVGDTDLLFTTVEFKNSPNTPLIVPDNARLKLPS